MSASSPKHFLKQSIESFDQQIKSSDRVSRSYNIPLSLLTSYDSDRDELIKKIHSMRINTLNKEKTLKNQLKSLKKHLETTAAKKKSELGSFKISKQALVSSIESLSLKLKQHEKVHLETSLLIEERNRILQSSHAVKEKVFIESLEPLEREFRMLSETKTELLEYILKLEEEENALGNKMQMNREENLELERLKFEITATKEETEVKFLIFCKEFHDELEFFKENDGKFKELASFKDAKIRFLEELNRLREDVKIKLFSQGKAKERLEKIGQEISWSLLSGGEWKLNKEILSLEQMLDKKIGEMKIGSLESFVEKENLLARFDLKREILRLQIIEIAKVEKNLRQELEFEEKQFYEKLLIKDYGKKEKRDLEEMFQLKKRKLRYRIFAIENWRSKAEKTVPSFTQKYSNSVKDKKLVQDFLLTITSFDSKKEVEFIVNSWIGKLINREKLQNSKLQSLQEKYSEKSLLEDSLYSLNKDLYNSQISILKLKQLLYIQECKENLIPNIKNPIIEEYFSLKSGLFVQKSYYLSNKSSLYSANEIKNDLKASLKTVKKIINSSKTKLKDIKHSLKSVNSQIVCIKDTKSLTLISEEISQETLYTLKENINSTKSELDSYLKELSSFELEFQKKLSQIEQEESKTRSQQQAVESALRNLEIDTKKIQEMESELSTYEDLEAPGLTEDIKPRVPSLRLEDLETNDIKEVEEIESSEDITHSISLNSQESLEKPAKFLKRSYKISKENISNSELILFEKIKPLLEGSELLIKFGRSKIRNFDVLDSLNIPPEQCGYSTRHFYLHKSLSKIEVKLNSKASSESIMIDEKWSVLISKNVLLVLKAQGHLKSNDLDYTLTKDQIKELKNFDVSSERFKSLCAGITLYPFTISLIQGDQIDLVAKGHKSFKYWINGFNGLIKHKNLIPNIRSRIEVIFN